MQKESEPKFEGWYFKHQKGKEVFAFIPGRAESGAFVQMLWNKGARHFSVPYAAAAGDFIRAGECIFSRYGCKISLPGVQGEIRYGSLSPLQRDVMGPLRFFPLECRHGVVSMAHTLRGSLTVDGTAYDLSGGIGYIEKDSGVSFPQWYLWVQCNQFPLPCALMAAAARVPLGRGSFTGCICAVQFAGREYLLASYNGARVLKAGPRQLWVAQGALLLRLDLAPDCPGGLLCAPESGQMSARVQEKCNAAVRLRLWKGGQLVLDLSSRQGMYEYRPPIPGPVSSGPEA